MSPPPPSPGHWVEERPEAGLAQGHYAWPAWAIVSFGAVSSVLALVALILVLRARRSARKSPHHEP